MTTLDEQRILADWARIGVLYGIVPARNSPDLERLLLDTARLSTSNPRVFVIAVTWLSRYGNFIARHRLKHLAEAQLEPDAQPVLGLLLDLAVKSGASPELQIAAKACRKAKTRRPLFAVHRASRVTEHVARKTSCPEALAWNLWAPAPQLKLDALRPVGWVLKHNPAYLHRIVRKGDLRCTILETLRRDAPAGVASEVALARLCSASRLAIRHALADLESEGYRLRTPADPRRRSTPIVLTDPVIPMIAA